MTKQEKIEYHILRSSFLTAKKLNSFVIRKKIKRLAYELNLFNNMKIHSIVSMIHLKQAKKNDFENNDFATLASKLIIVDDYEKYVAEKILKKKIKKSKPDYLMK